jgi:two-component system sensor histidine kinase QseC
VSRSLVTRLALLEQFTVIGAIVAFGLLTLWITASELDRESRAFVNATATRLAKSFEEDLLEERDTLGVARGLLEDGREVGVQVEVARADHVVLASSLAPLKDPASGAAAAAGARRGNTFAATAASRGGTRVTVVARDQATHTVLSALVRALLLAALPIVVFSLWIGRAIVDRAVRPLSDMAERAASLAVERTPRSLGQRSGLIEVDRLAVAFDRLLERLDDAMRSERRLTADASHELRTPLTVLGGELDMMLERAPVDSPAADGLRRSAEQVGAMRELVEAILLLHRSGDHAGNQGDAFELLNLCDLVRETSAEVVGQYAGRASDVGLDAPDEILVRGNGALLASAVRNLLDNALKFTHAGARIELHLREANRQALLVVDDQGPGVPEAERERIFDPFYRGARTKVEPSGFGLGLPILRRVARAHEGDVEVTRSHLGGSRFTLRLPSAVMEGQPRR